MVSCIEHWSAYNYLYLHLLKCGCKYVWKPRSAISRTTPISACGGPTPHAGERSPRAELSLRMRANVLRVRRDSSACGRKFSACGDDPPHAEVPSLRAETLLPMRRYLLSVRRRTFACGDALLGVRRPCSACESALLGVRRRTPACGDALLGVRRPYSACGGALLGVRRPCSACGGSVFTCGDLFFKLSQPSCFITPLVLIVASFLAWLTS